MQCSGSSVLSVFNLSPTSRSLSMSFPSSLATAAPPAAHVIGSDAEAIEVARALAGRFAEEASVRDRERRLPVAELDEFSASGLWAITVPKAYGGAGGSYVTLSA
ncbi:SfnB family sulfur acquisition oxidoreductase, partial [Pseudomonas syringae]|nr:SfnB family sulfur acquisition oxidoreductase [Pseudomonas syringae]